MRATRSARPVAMSQACRLGLTAIGLVTVSRLLGPTEFGLFAMVTAVLGIGELFRDLGLSLAAIRAPSLDRQQQDNLFWINLGIGALLAALAAAGSRAIADLYAHPVVAVPLMITGVTFLVNGAAAQYRVRLIRADRFGALAVSDVVAQAVALAAAVGLAASGAGLWSLVAQAVLQPAVGLVLLVWSTRWRPGLPSRGAGTRAFLGFGGNLLGVQVLGYLGRNLDNILLGRFWGAAALGLYSKAYTLYQMPQQQALAPFTDLVVRSLAAAGDDRELYLRRLRSVQSVANYVTLTIFGTLIALAHPIVRILLGPRWDESAVLLQILSIGGIFQLIGYVNYWIFLVEGMTRLHFRMALVTQPVAIACIVCGVPFGAEGVAWGATAGLLVEWVVPATFGTARSSVSAIALLTATVRPLAVSTVFAIAAGLAASVVPDVAPLQVAVGVAAGLVAVALVLVMWSGARREVVALKDLASSLVRRRRRVLEPVDA